MRPSRLTLPLLLAAATTLGGCAYNADLGRDQLLIVKDDNLAAEGEKAWADTLRTAYISKEPRKNERVRAVGQRVIEAAGLSNRPWDYAVFLDEAPNAFVLPGGHVGVTVGLLAMVQNDDQLAAVIGHEAGHVVAHHAAERASQQTTAKVLLGIAGAARRRRRPREQYSPAVHTVPRGQSVGNWALDARESICGPWIMPCADLALHQVHHVFIQVVRDIRQVRVRRLRALVVHPLRSIAARRQRAQLHASGS